MESTVANNFVSAFNPMEKTHVLWLRRMNRAMEKLDPTANMNLTELVNSNPMGAKMTNGADWVFIHFSLAMAYTKAVLEGLAWVPSK
jgi:hypothetical protein